MIFSRCRVEAADSGRSPRLDSLFGDMLTELLFFPVIFEYKARLEKSLAEEKSSNTAVKQELQQRASREKSLRDKNTVEAMQRFNSLQQTYKLLQTEHKDLEEECKKREKQAFDDTNRLESTLQDLRSRIRQAQEKVKSMETLKTKYMNLQMNMDRLQDKYNEQINMNDETENTIKHLQKEVSQLKRELEKAKVRVFQRCLDRTSYTLMIELL